MNNVAYAPLLAQDAGGNAQLAVIGLGINNPAVTTISLPAASFPVGVTYDPAHKTLLAEAILTAGGRAVYEIDAASQAVLSTTPLTGLSGQSGNAIFGGIIEDPARHTALVAGLTDIGLLDTSSSPPVWQANSLTPTVQSDSLALNTKTGMAFVSAEGANQIIDTTQSPLTPMSFSTNANEGGGIAFDPTTNIALFSPENSGDERWAFNFTSLDTGVSPATAPSVLIPGLGESGITGQGHGGQAVVNCSTHQGVSADEYGQNFTLIQLPARLLNGNLDNNGQPGSGTAADASSAYTIAAASLPQPNIGGTQYSIVTQGNPNSIAVDPSRNMLYLLAADQALHQEFFLEIDLSAPVLGASPTGGIDGSTFWDPNTITVLLPKS